MSALDIVTAASEPAFYSRVAFISLKVAQMIGAEAEDYPNHDNRVGYANRILKGEDNAILLAQHVATNATISGFLETIGPEGPQDGDIEFVLTSIWDARANAFAPQGDPLLAMSTAQREAMFAMATEYVNNATTNG